MRRSTLITFAAGVMAGWWAARRTPEARPQLERPLPAPPESPVEAAAAPAGPRAPAETGTPMSKEAPATTLPPADTPPAGSPATLRTARTTIDARMRDLRRPRRSR